MPELATMLQGAAWAEQQQAGRQAGAAFELLQLVACLLPVPPPAWVPPPPAWLPPSAWLPPPLPLPSLISALSVRGSLSVAEEGD